MRFDVSVLAAISSMRAPARPLAANSFIATETMFARVPSGSYFRRLRSPVAAAPATALPTLESAISQPLGSAADTVD